MNKETLENLIKTSTKNTEKLKKLENAELSKNEVFEILSEVSHELTSMNSLIKTLIMFS